MAEKHTTTFEVDRSMLFDMLAKMGGDTDALGTRLVSALLGDDGMINALGLAVYGICLLPNEGTTPNG